MSEREEQFLRLWQKQGLEAIEWKRNHTFDVSTPGHKKRRWRIDFASPEHLIGVEIEGITSFTRGESCPVCGQVPIALGGHQSAKGFHDNCLKYNRALILGWRLLRYTQRALDRSPIAVIEEICGLFPEELGPSRRQQRLQGIQHNTSPIGHRR